MFNEDEFAIGGIKMTLYLLINGSSFRRDQGIPDCKGAQDEHIKVMIEDAIAYMTEKKTLYEIDRVMFRYIFILASELTVDWFDGIDPEHLTIPDYQRLLDFFNTYEYNKKWYGKYTDSQGLVWCNNGSVYVNGEQMKLLAWDYTTRCEENKELVENLKSPVVITNEEFEANYKVIRKEYE